MIKTSAYKFKISLDKWAAKTRGKMLEFAVEVIQDINQEVVIATGAGPPMPNVITGFLRGSWHASINAPIGGRGGDDPSGSQTVAQLNATLLNLKLGDIYYARNGAEYAMRVHFGFVGQDALGRSIHQHPRPFVTSVLDRAPRIAADRLRQMNGK